MSDASSSLKWTKEFPQESGVYWWRPDPDDNDPEIYDLDITGDIIYGMGSSHLMRLEELEVEGGEFLGPITPAVK